jgi:hypothetical protein
MKASLTSITILGALLLSLQANGQMRGKGTMNMSMIRHHFVMRNGVGPEYASKVNPLERSTGNIVAGKKQYETNCALCHGATGLGDGEAGKELEPPPANIAMFMKMRDVPDGYLYWTIAEGGVPLRTAMPPFKDTMEEDDIWKTIIFLREL